MKKKCLESFEVVWDGLNYPKQTQTISNSPKQKTMNDKEKNNERPSIGDWVIEKNNQFIALSKPAGVPVQADKTGDKSLLQLAEIYTKSKLNLVHRIDRPASGVVLFAKNKKAVGLLGDQFREKQVSKTYLAVVKSKPENDSGTLRHYLKKNGKTKKSMAHNEEVEGGKLSELKYKLLGSSDNYHLLEVEPVSGRFHQIRAQLAAIGSPIKGDVKYGARRSNRDRSIHLHAWKLEFSHPVSKEKISLQAPLPNDSIWDYFKENVLKN